MRFSSNYKIIVTYSLVFYCVLLCFIVFLSLYFTYCCINLFSPTAAMCLLNVLTYHPVHKQTDRQTAAIT